MKLYNITFNLRDTKDRLIPAIPESAGATENKTIQRVCLTDSIEHCMQAIATCNRNIAVGKQFIVREVEIPANHSKLIHPKQLYRHKLVPDALENNEYWYLESIRCKVYLCTIQSFSYEHTVAWSCITAKQVREIIEKYTKCLNLSKYKKSITVYNAFCTWAEKEKQYKMEDDVWDDIVMLPWAQKTEIRNIKFKINEKYY